MRLPHPQPWHDWTTQLWNLLLGRRLGPDLPWLEGPRGLPGAIDGATIEQIAAREGLAIDDDSPDIGLLGSLGFLGAAEVRLHPEVARFYLHTSTYDLDVWTAWRPGWRPFAGLVDRIFARRIRQLSLPQNPLETARGLSSSVVALRSPDGTAKYRFWIRRLRESGRTVYVGSYDGIVLAGAVPCVRVVFPLPHGSATVVLRGEVEEGGALVLSSRGEKCGDPGFYFVVEDRRGGLWCHFIRSFTERIRVYADGSAGIRADHSMDLFGRRVFDLHYRAVPRAVHRSPP